jgi:predicted DNA-binding transcriptional regulator AlpA
MALVSGDDPDTTWPPHPDTEAEQMFREAHHAGYVIFCLERIYTLMSPSAKTMSFPRRVMPSSGVRRHMLAELRGWLAQTMKDESEGQG